MEIVVFLGALFIAAVLVMWWSRRGGGGDSSPSPMADGDQPEVAISNESTIGPHRNVGRPWRVDRGNSRDRGGPSD